MPTTPPHHSPFQNSARPLPPPPFPPPFPAAPPESPPAPSQKHTAADGSARYVASPSSAIYG